MQAKVLKVSPKAPQAALIKKAAKAVKEGRLVVFPTETVYGIAVNADDPVALKTLCKIKKRPKGKPFTLHIASMKQLQDFGCRPGKKTMAILKKYWPGPLTAILKTKSGKKVGFRIPDNKIALNLIKQAKVPVVAPSANIAGGKAPTSARQVPKKIKEEVDFILDGGRTELKVSSTVIDFSGPRPKIIREGALKNV